MTKISEIAIVGTEALANDLFEKENAAGDSEQITGQMIKDFVLAGFAGPAIRGGSAIYVDNLWGDDSTGEAYNAAKPFYSIAGAQGVITGEDCLVIRPSPNPYTDVNMGASGVWYHFEHGAKMDSAGNCFNTFGSSVGFRVTGFGWFESTSSVLFASGTGEIYFQGLYANGKGNGSRTIWQFGSNVINIDIATDLLLDGAESVIVVSAPNAVMNVRVGGKMKGQGGLVGTGSAADDCVVNLWASSYLYDPAVKGYVGFNLERGTVNVRGGNVTISDNGIYSVWAMWLRGTGAKLIIEGDILCLATDGMLSVSAADCYFEAKGKVDTVGFINFSSGTGIFRKAVRRYVTTGPVIELIASGDANVTTEDFIINSINDVAAVGVQKDDGTYKVTATGGFYCQGATAEAIASATPQEIHVNGFPVSNSAIGGGITQRVSTINVDPFVIP